jgi:hypothetical protein
MEQAMIVHPAKISIVAAFICTEFAGPTIHAELGANTPPGPGSAPSTDDGRAAARDAAPVAEDELLPDRVRGHYPSCSPGNTARGAPDERGWAIRLNTKPRVNERTGSWSGYCFDLNPVDARRHRRLQIELADVTRSEEVEVKLEREDSRHNAMVLRRLRSGKMAIDLNNYSAVRAEIARLCIMLSASVGTTEPMEAQFVMVRAAVQ